MSEYIKGKSFPNRYKIIELARALSCSTEYLYKEEVEDDDDY